MTDDVTFDLERRTVSFRCIVCRWKFRCPVEQIGRIICYPCESVRNAEATTQTR